MSKKERQSAKLRFQRLAIVNFWSTRAAILERQAMTLLREAAKARVNADQVALLPDDGVNRLFAVLTGKDGAAAEVKTVVQPDGGKGKVN
ncbi:hypothetical protein [Solidesulfovibrio sp.]